MHVVWGENRATGHVDEPLVDSLYLRLRNHNLCNHNDFQNIGGTFLFPPYGNQHAAAHQQPIAQGGCFEEFLFLTCFSFDDCVMLMCIQSMGPRQRISWASPSPLLAMRRLTFPFSPFTPRLAMTSATTPTT